MVTHPAGALLPHRFTLTCAHEEPSAVYSLLHFPYSHERWALPTTASCGARTFLQQQNCQRPFNSLRKAIVLHSFLIDLSACRMVPQIQENLLKPLAPLPVASLYSAPYSGFLS